MNNQEQVTVGIVMGSDSDLPIMKEAADFLDEVGVSYELKVISAHRTPEMAKEYATTAAGRGLKVIIAGAGKAAHLPGVLASHTTLPVIGVPVKTSTLGGADSLYSMVQMPSGVPVATVALNGAHNAAVLALQILSTDNDELQKKMREYKEKVKNESISKNDNLDQKLNGLD